MRILTASVSSLSFISSRDNRSSTHLHLHLQHQQSPSKFFKQKLKSKKKPSFNTTSLLSSRQSRQCSQVMSADEKGIKNFHQELATNMHDIAELRSLDQQNCKVTLEVMPYRNDYASMGKIFVEFSLLRKDCTVKSFNHEDVAVSELSFSSWLKCLVLIGFFTLGGSQQAVASSGIATGLSSLLDLGELGDISTGFASAFLLIFFSELGDKTFFIAALLAARNSATIVFIGTFGALAAMSIISVVIGRTFHYVDDILPFRFGDTDLPIDDIAAVGLLIYFGVSTLIEAASSDAPKAEEEQKEAELAVSGFSGDGAGILAAASTVISTFVLVFVAEWGDKSFFSTIALAAASSPLGVIGGAVAGHAVATLLAVLGGSLLGTFLSEKVIAYIGGTLFLVFAAVTLIEILT